MELRKETPHKSQEVPETKGFTRPLSKVREAATAAGEENSSQGTWRRPCDVLSCLQVFQGAPHWVAFQQCSCLGELLVLLYVTLVNSLVLRVGHNNGLLCWSLAGSVSGPSKIHSSMSPRENPHNYIPLPSPLEGTYLPYINVHNFLYTVSFTTYKALHGYA